MAQYDSRLSASNNNGIISSSNKTNAYLAPSFNPFQMIFKGNDQNEPLRNHINLSFPALSSATTAIYPQQTYAPTTNFLQHPQISAPFAFNSQASYPIAYHSAFFNPQPSQLPYHIQACPSTFIVPAQINNQKGCLLKNDDEQNNLPVQYKNISSLIAEFDSKQKPTKPEALSELGVKQKRKRGRPRQKQNDAKTPSDVDNSKCENRSPPIKISRLDIISNLIINEANELDDANNKNDKTITEQEHKPVKKYRNACDECTIKKIKCVLSEDATSCLYCAKKQIPCKFSIQRKRGPKQVHEPWDFCKA